MRKDDVAALLDHAANDLNGSSLGSIEQQYKEALSEKKIPTFLSIDIKNFMENLRSALDYMAHDIYEVAIKPERDKIGTKAIKSYFPYGKTENDFKSRLGSELPNLQSLNPKFFALVESVQPHNSNDPWPYEFCSILNDKKHDTLSPQIKTEMQTMTASVPAGSFTMPINSPNLSVHQGQNVQITLGGIPMRVSNQGIEPLAPGIERIITTWVSFQFADTNTPVLPLLKKALEKILTLSNQIYKEFE